MIWRRTPALSCQGEGFNNINHHLILACAQSHLGKFPRTSRGRPLQGIRLISLTKMCSGFSVWSEWMFLLSVPRVSCQNPQHTYPSLGVLFSRYFSLRAIRRNFSRKTTDRPTGGDIKRIWFSLLLWISHSNLLPPTLAHCLFFHPYSAPWVYLFSPVAAPTKPSTRLPTRLAKKLIQGVQPIHQQQLFFSGRRRSVQNTVYSSIETFVETGFRVLRLDHSQSDANADKTFLLM